MWDCEINKVVKKKIGRNLYSIWIYKSIDPSVIYSAYVFRVKRKLEPISAGFGPKAG